MASAKSPVNCAVCGDSSVTANNETKACKHCVNFFNLGFRGRGCRNGGGCAITKSTRAACIACRYDKCQEMGMVSKRKITEYENSTEKVHGLEEEVSRLRDRNDRLETAIEAVNLRLDTFLKNEDKSKKDSISLNTSHEDSDIKLAELIMTHLGLTSDLPFEKLTIDNQILVGNRLGQILGIVGSGAMVSLINYTLSNSAQCYSE